MSKGLVELLKGDKFDTKLDDIIKDIRIDRVVVNSQSKKWEIFIKINSQIDNKIIRDIEYRIKDTYRGVENVSIIQTGIDTESDSLIIETKAKLGHKVNTITDHGVDAVSNANKTSLNGEFVVLDIETTGLSYMNDKIIEIGAVRIRDGIICDRFNSLIDPEIDIPQNIVALTGINNEMVKGKPKIDEVMPLFIEFAGGAVLAAHNARFDLSFIKKNANELGYNIKNPVVDTLTLSKSLFTNLKKHKLDVVAKHLNINLKNHHRAVDDAECAGKILLKCFGMLKEKGIQTIKDINIEGCAY